MKVLRDDKYNSILEAARNEFIDKGFKDASMRTIAREAGVGLSNIYNYFTNKDDIFLTIVMPAKDHLFAFLREKHTEEHIDFNFMSTFAYQEETVEEYIDLLEEYKDELRLLLYHSEGSSIKSFRDIFTEYLTDVSNHHNGIIAKHYPQVHDASPFLMHTLCAFMVSVVGEIITHNLSKQDMREFFREYFIFQIAGWRKLIGI